MRISGFVFSAAVLALFATASAAQDRPPAPSSDEIVVEGRKVSKEQIREFVRSLTNVPYMGQVGRFHARVCPVAMGLMPVQNQSIAARMRDVAAAAGIGAASEPCTPNVFVIVTPDKKAAIDELEHRFPSYFSGLSRGQVQNLASDPSPAVAWQVRSRLSSDKQALNKPADGDYYVLQGAQNPSRIKAATMPTFVASVVVIDLKAAAGLTLTELADYAAMRTYASTDPESVAKTGAPTILGVLAQPDNKLLPVTLTYWDLGFLKALYSTDNAYYAGYQRGDMEQVMKEELDHARDVRQP